VLKMSTQKKLTATSSANRLFNNQAPTRCLIYFFTK
jgi:hypothetical protein